MMKPPKNPVSAPNDEGTPRAVSNGFRIAAASPATPPISRNLTTMFASHMRTR